MKKYNIALVIIATGKYHQFIDPLLESARKYFLIQDDVTFYVFSDRIGIMEEDCVLIPTKHEPWPGPTLHRYRNIVSAKGLFAGIDYIFYCDVDMLFVDNVGREILGKGLTATLHPGFAMFPGKGSWGSNARSTAFTHMAFRKKYYAGGFQGGTAKRFMFYCEVMAANIKQDEENGVMAEHHDETHWNMTVNNNPEHICLDPSYCMVEEKEKRKLWKIDHLKPKIIALAKDHKTMRT